MIVRARRVRRRKQGVYNCGSVKEYFLKCIMKNKVSMAPGRPPAGAGVDCGSSGWQQPALLPMLPAAFGVSAKGLYMYIHIYTYMYIHSRQYLTLTLCFSLCPGKYAKYCRCRQQCAGRQLLATGVHLGLPGGAAGAMDSKGFHITL